MKLSRFMFILICPLVGVAMAGCGHSPQIPSPPHQSAAGIMEKLTLEQLTARADSILVGKVTDITVHKEGKGNIYTLVTLSMEQTIKGETGGEVVIRVPGGEVGGLVLMVTDTPSFQLGERAVVFLDKGEGIFNVVGGFQGKFSIDENNMVSGNMPLTEFINQIKAEVDKGSR